LPPKSDSDLQDIKELPFLGVRMVNGRIGNEHLLLSKESATRALVIKTEATVLGA
jgi:hypothetical protein